MSSSTPRPRRWWVTSAMISRSAGAGADSTASLTFEVPVGSGDHEVVVFVDSIDDVPEEDELDNQFTATLGGVRDHRTGPRRGLFRLPIRWRIVLFRRCGEPGRRGCACPRSTSSSTSPFLERRRNRRGRCGLRFRGRRGLRGMCVLEMVDGYDAVEESDESNRPVRSASGASRPQSRRRVAASRPASTNRSRGAGVVAAHPPHPSDRTIVVIVITGVVSRAPSA